ncbi:MAG: hypothetical protein FK731_14160 [Asgard group archaeon]|nr:hypothetical protein [Asgard group archaeon]
MANIIIRFLWTILIGSWLTPIWFLLGSFFTHLVFTARIGMWFFDKIEFVYSLHKDEERERYTFAKTAKSILWFWFIGSWVGLIIIALASACVGLIITIPIGWWLVNRLDKVVILEPSSK